MNRKRFTVEMIDKNYTWDHFKLTNIDERGVHNNFEDLCRQLFIREYLSSNKIIKYVHSNPNNPGIEADPVLDEINNKWLGYQAKFFDSRPSYKQILDSAQKTVENYAGKIDIVFLYCNRPLSIKAADFQKAEKLLNDNNIKLILITDNAIFDLLKKHPDLEKCYFGQHPISHVWLKKHNHRMFDHMGERFNKAFNVDTLNDLTLSFFLHGKSAVDNLNDRKKNCLERANSYKDIKSEFKEYLEILISKLLEIPDINDETIADSFQWYGKVYPFVKVYCDQFVAERNRLEDKINPLFEKAFKTEYSSWEQKEKAKCEYDAVKNRFETLNELVNLVFLLRISDVEKRWLSKKVMSVSGKAGMGKSQLLANAVNLLMESGRNALLLLGHLFYTEQPLPIQITEKCNLDFPFDELINILEVMGERQNKIVPLVIDAINETWNYLLWKDALPIIVDKVESCSYVKLVFSYRPEYEKYLFNSELLEKVKGKTICKIIHKGFAVNTPSAKKRFFTYYGIPFTPNEYFSYELDNPLFLKLYCETYKEGDISLPLLYERLLSAANEKLHIVFQKKLRELGYIESDNLLTPFITEMASNLIVKEDKRLLKDELIQFKCWQQIGIPARSFIPHVVRENLLYNFVDEKGEHYFFAYDQMNDYYCAKSLVKQCNSKSELRDKVEKILCIGDGMIGKLENIDLFVNISAIDADCCREDGEICITILDEVTDENDRAELLDRLVLSFMWRNKDTVSGQFFLDLCGKYSAEVDTFWKVLISNSVKINHPLNADFLHSLLLGYDLNERDYVWTTYINDTFTNDDNRVVQLIHKYVKGEKFAMQNEKQTELLLTLFGWFLTSSSRELRDYTSKAMIEILKDNFALCEVLLKKFERVNDPYVIQRLYGVVFGACCKRQGNQLDIYKTLAEYVYETVFNQESVYPDILLRDYARLIIKRFLWEQPVYDGVINKLKIKSPYNSEPIPAVEEDYLKLDCTGGIRCIKSSMHFVDKGFYGDFGRYVFQSALSNFEVDHNQIFNYAMHFIIHVLGYKEELFGDYDFRLDKYNFKRENIIKIERIGKKYQWIAMYNILARVADNYKMKRRYDDEPDEIQYEGPWTLYLRDFDPTLNQSFMKCKEAPVLSMIEEFLAEAQEENNQKLLSLKGHEEEWLGEEGYFFRNLKNALLLEDDSGKQWLALTNYCGTNGKNLLNEGLAVWSWLYAFFVTPEQERMLLQLNAEGNDLRCFDYRSNTIYTLFNREFPWADGSELYKKQAWVEPVINNVRASLNQLFIKNIGKIMHASYDWAWDAEYDATKSETVIWSLPCAELIETLELKQQEYDSFYYDNNGQLAAFDVRRVQDNGRAVIRKDLLDKFLAERKLRLIWIVNAEKEIHNPVTRLVSQYSEWTGVLSYDGSDINGRLWRIKK